MSTLPTEIQQRSALWVKLIASDSREEATRIAVQLWPEWDEARRSDIVDSVLAATQTNQ